MKVAHLAEFGPHRSGLYGTTKDLILAERSVGIDAVLVDAHVTKDKKIVSRAGLKDGDLPIRQVDWAREADILVHHSIIHQDLRNLGIPIVLAIHGRPESTFLLEHRRVASIFGATMEHAADSRYNAFFTFWEQYMFHLRLMIPKEKLFYVPAPVDLKEYCPTGQTHDFAGSPKILIVDMWRHDVTPFNTIMAATRFKQKYAPQTKIHILGAAPKKSSVRALMKMLTNDGVLGEIHPAVENTPICYRGADIVVTPHNIATRVVRESLACGTPIVAGTGNPYTPFTADSRDAEKFADEINKCWTWTKSIPDAKVRQTVRDTAIKEFNPEQTGQAAKAVFEKVLANEKARWTKQSSGLHRKVYATYQDYLREQKSKLDGGISFLKDYNTKYRNELRARLQKLSHFTPGRNGCLTVLCLGARSGAEVAAFIDVGCFAVGIDLNPGKENRYVVTGDFHKLQYPPSSVDVAFTNSLDHSYRPKRLLNEVSKVLKPKGLFIVELEGPKKKGADRWASLHWDNEAQLVTLFGEFSLGLIEQSEFKSMWFRKQLVFQLQGES